MINICSSREIIADLTKSHKPNSKKPKSDKILDVLGLLEEKGKSKDWILEEIKKHRIHLNVPPILNSSEILKACPDDFVDHLFSFLKEDEFHVEEVNSFTKTLHWFFTDIVASADPTVSTKAQVRKINLLNSLIQKTETFKQRDPHTTVILPTGDGMAIGFSESPEQPLRLAIDLHQVLNKYNKTQREKDKILLRIGMDSGTVYFLKDVEGNDAVWGQGIILARRVMDLCSSNQIFASMRIGSDISNLSPEYKEIMHQIGVYEVKHGTQLTIYNIYGKGFGNKTSPKTGKIRKQKEELTVRKEPDFHFNSVEIKIDVTDLKTMMAHHTWIWDLKSNLKKIPLEHIFYNIGGDVPKDFEDMNLKITDEDKNKLEIASLEVNKPHEKSFYVKLTKPIKFSHKGRFLKLEYDWEEPDRVFEYVFSSRCKKFKYLFTIPKGIQIKNRILEVNRELGLKKRSDIPAKIKYLPNKTEVSWSSNKKYAINRHDAFEFQW